MNNTANTILQEYSYYKMEAFNLYMKGLLDEASLYYGMAFETNKKLHEIILIDKTHVQRTLDITLDCLDFVCDDKNALPFLNDAIDIFMEVIYSNCDKVLKNEAIMAYSELATLVESKYKIHENILNNFKSICYKQN